MFISQRYVSSLTKHGEIPHISGIFHIFHEVNESYGHIWAKSTVSKSQCGMAVMGIADIHEGRLQGPLFDVVQ